MKNKRLNSDLAIESLHKAIKDQDYTYNIEKYDDVKIESYHILKENYDYNKGTYIEMSFESYQNMNTIITQLKKQIKKLIHSLTHKIDPTILIVGLGNKDLSCDALGPSSVSLINATHHYHISDRHSQFLYDYICIIPNVSAQSGLETASYVEAIVKEHNVDLVIAIDSLRAFDYEKLCKVIQINNVGIYPGSGIGNHRKGINEMNLNVPVIGIGVPTVIHASSLVNGVFSLIEGYFHESMQLSSKLKVGHRDKYEGVLNQYQRKMIFGELGDLSVLQREQLLTEILSPLDYNYIFSHKQIDFDIKILSRIISDALNEIKNDSI